MEIGPLAGQRYGQLVRRVFFIAQVAVIIESLNVRVALQQRPAARWSIRTACAPVPVLHYGDVQRMSASTCVLHSEFNYSSDEEVHFLQIWIEPNVSGIAPSYAETRFDAASKTGRLGLIASPDGRDDSVQIHQDVTIHASILKATRRSNTRWPREDSVM